MTILLVFGYYVGLLRLFLYRGVFFPGCRCHSRGASRQGSHRHRPRSRRQEVHYAHGGHHAYVLLRIARERASHYSRRNGSQDRFRGGHLRKGGRAFVATIVFRFPVVCHVYRGCHNGRDRRTGYHGGRGTQRRRNSGRDVATGRRRGRGHVPYSYRSGTRMRRASATRGLPRRQGRCRRKRGLCHSTGYARGYVTIVPTLPARVVLRGVRRRVKHGVRETIGRCGNSSGHRYLVIIGRHQGRLPCNQYFRVGHKFFPSHRANSHGGRRGRCHGGGYGPTRAHTLVSLSRRVRAFRHGGHGGDKASAQAKAHRDYWVFTLFSAFYGYQGRQPREGIRRNVNGSPRGVDGNYVYRGPASVPYQQYNGRRVRRSHVTRNSGRGP